ncbi:unnamed protein product [Rhizoctonia solani]|uniref:F-box domain-containing protein n=1 Tax=Rhizoctonia solani TaxID=456999 RepID=A0A8H3H715_9AGAM|nr:unnamed protein product [Rhizoctonia solani]
MPTTRSTSKRSILPVAGQRVGINRLPPEVLSTIFVICNRTWDLSDGNWSVFVCQTVLPATCSYWRKVALETPALWTKVTLSEPVPWRFSELCLARAGPASLLDIEIDMREDFWAETEEGTLEELAERAEGALAFIVKHGGVPARWKTFWMITDAFLAQLAVIKFFQKSRFPSLISLEMMFEGPDEFDDEDENTLIEEIGSQPKILFKEPPPQLRSVKLQGVPPPYLFGHPTRPQLAGLTHLVLRLEGLYPSLDDLNKMLAANPNLETLSLNSETIGESIKVGQKKSPKVHLPKLQSLSFISVASSSWTSHTLMMLDVPNVNSFGLILSVGQHSRQVGTRKLLNHIIGDGSQATPVPRFPSLRSLTLASEMQLGFEHEIADVLAAYPQLTALTLPICPSLAPLLKRPWLAPNLERLKAGVRNLVQLKKVVNSRCKAGLPLRTVLVEYLELEVKVKPSDLAQLRKHVDFAVVHDNDERLDD